MLMSSYRCLCGVAYCVACRSPTAKSLSELREQLVRKFGKNGEEEVIRKNSDTKASPGRMDAKIQVCLQTQTSCSMEAMHELLTLQR